MSGYEHNIPKTSQYQHVSAHELATTVHSKSKYNKDYDIFQLRQPRSHPAALGAVFNLRGVTRANGLHQDIQEENEFD